MAGRNISLSTGHAKAVSSLFNYDAVAANHIKCHVYIASRLERTSEANLRVAGKQRQGEQQSGKVLTADISRQGEVSRLEAAVSLGKDSRAEILLDGETLLSASVQRRRCRARQCSIAAQRRWMAWC